MEGLDADGLALVLQGHLPDKAISLLAGKLCYPLKLRLLSGIIFLYCYKTSELSLCLSLCLDQYIDGSSFMDLNVETLKAFEVPMGFTVAIIKLIAAIKSGTKVISFTQISECS